MNINSIHNSNEKTDTIVILVDSSYVGDKIIAALIESKDFKVETAGTTHLTVETSEDDVLQKTLYVATGSLDEFNESTGNIDVVAKSIVAYLKGSPSDILTVAAENNAVRDCGLEALCSSLVIADYNFSLEDKPSPLTINILFDDEASATQAGPSVSDGVDAGNAINYTRRLGDLPSNVCTPTYMARQAVSQFKQDNVRVSVIGESEAKELNMGGFMSVTQGSDEEGKIIIFEYTGDANNSDTVALVGKAVTFDSGGISIKPSASMEEMKYDMCGGATVFGVIKAAADMQLPVNLIGVVGAVENMPSGNATRPGDIINMMSGKTVEVTNTDAEGRMVLADLLTYVGENYKPTTVLDLATLTGACCVALGEHAAGIFTEDDALATSLYDSGQKVNDRVWRLPMWEDYNKQMDSDFADMGNSGKRGAGASTAACFLNRFASDYDYKWAHIDIAGVAWKGKATGRPVKMLLDYLTTGK